MTTHWGSRRRTSTSADRVHSDACARRIAQVRRERLPCADLGNGHFANPLMVGPGADNTIVRVGDDYYMMAGGGWPDQLVWHSRDLINWRPLTRALRKWDGRA